LARTTNLIRRNELALSVHASAMGSGVSDATFNCRVWA